MNQNHIVLTNLRLESEILLYQTLFISQSCTTARFGYIRTNTPPSEQARRGGKRAKVHAVHVKDNPMSSLPSGRKH